ncbi:winged helix DNA-binding protein, partial [candidate division WWE3 bacterium]|nr:winged helix DNA-binding protein [candidate division WWE3 bacterium]
SAAIAQYLNRLEKSGLIEKQTDQDDKRISRIFVSDKGRKELKPIKKVFSERFGEILSPLSHEELDQLIVLHRKILASLEAKHTHENS